MNKNILNRLNPLDTMRNLIKVDKSFNNSTLSYMNMTNIEQQEWILDMLKRLNLTEYADNFKYHGVTIEKLVR